MPRKVGIPEGYKGNFETLQRAVRNGDVCLMECTEKRTGKKAILLCAVNRPDGEYEMIPLARMIDGNPYEMFDPPV